MFSKARNFSAVMFFLLLTPFLGGCADTAPETKLATAKAKADHCVEPLEDIRVNHMAYLLHQRDETMYKGIRTKRHSFKECINCHVPAEENGKPVNYLTDDHDLNPDHFCATCHLYVGVKLDCFECHSDNPKSAAPADSTHATATGLKTTQKTNATSVLDATNGSATHE